MSDPDLHLKPLSAQSSIANKTRTPSMKSMTPGGEKWQGMFQTVGMLTSKQWAVKQIMNYTVTIIHLYY